MNTIKKAILLATKKLKNITDIPKKEAMILLSSVLDKDSTWIVLHEDDELKEWDSFFSLVQRREEGEPIEYITKRVSFYSNEFFIDKGALIPRPETELLVDEVIKNLDKSKELTIAEIGVGSGIVSIMLAKLLPYAKIIATDISEDALNIAKINVKKFGLEGRIELLKCSYLDRVNEPIDVIVSNPPYVADDFKVAKPLLFEPKEAIFGGKGGDEILKTIIKLAKKRSVKLLACEMGYDQKSILQKDLDKFGFDRYYFYKDLAGLDRGFVVYGKKLLYKYNI